MKGGETCRENNEWLNPVLKSIVHDKSPQEFDREQRKTLLSESNTYHKKLDIEASQGRQIRGYEEKAGFL